MLAGLIFAIEEASDRPGSLVATLPFGGMTLLEYQIRLLNGAGAEQMLVAVGKMTPGLLAAVNRASKRAGCASRSCDRPRKRRRRPIPTRACS
jgi:hypothetical protein